MKEVQNHGNFFFRLIIRDFVIIFYVFFLGMQYRPSMDGVLRDWQVAFFQEIFQYVNHFLDTKCLLYLLHYCLNILFHTTK